MERIASENLFLVEFLVDNLIVNKYKNDENIYVSFQFWNNAPFYISSRDFLYKQSENIDEINCGKSCYFPMTVDQIYKAICEFNVNVKVVKEIVFTPQINRQTLGKAIISLSGKFNELIREVYSTDRKTFVTSLKNTFSLLNTSGNIVGSIELCIHISCLDKNNVESIQGKLKHQSSTSFGVLDNVFVHATKTCQNIWDLMDKKHELKSNSPSMKRISDLQKGHFDNVRKLKMLQNTLNLEKNKNEQLQKLRNINESHCSNAENRSYKYLDVSCPDIPSDKYSNKSFSPCCGKRFAACRNEMLCNSSDNDIKLQDSLRRMRSGCCMEATDSSRPKTASGNLEIWNRNYETNTTNSIRQTGNKNCLKGFSNTVNKDKGYIGNLGAEKSQSVVKLCPLERNFKTCSKHNEREQQNNTLFEQTLKKSERKCQSTQPELNFPNVSQMCPLILKNLKDNKQSSEKICSLADEILQKGVKNVFGTKKIKENYLSQSVLMSKCCGCSVQGSLKNTSSSISSNTSNSKSQGATEFEEISGSMNGNPFSITVHKEKDGKKKIVYRPQTAPQLSKLDICSQGDPMQPESANCVDPSRNFKLSIGNKVDGTGDQEPLVDIAVTIPFKQEPPFYESTGVQFEEDIAKTSGPPINALNPKKRGTGPRRHHGVNGEPSYDSIDIGGKWSVDSQGNKVFKEGGGVWSEDSEGNKVWVEGGGVWSVDSQGHKVWVEGGGEWSVDSQGNKVWVEGGGEWSVDSDGNKVWIEGAGGEWSVDSQGNKVWVEGGGRWIVDSKGNRVWKKCGGRWSVDSQGNKVWHGHKRKRRRKRKKRDNEGVGFVAVMMSSRVCVSNASSCFPDYSPCDPSACPSIMSNYTNCCNYSRSMF